MKISIFSLGYVGAVSFGCLVRQGHDAIGVDVDSHKLTLLTKGISPVVEEGMPELIEEAMRSGRARVTSDAAEAVADSEISFVCVGTPSRRNGAHDLTALRHVCEQLGRAIRDKRADHITVIRSTVAPGTTEDVLVADFRKSFRQTDWPWIACVLSTGVPARRCFDQGLREPTDDDCRR